MSLVVAACATSEYRSTQREWTRSQESYTALEGQAFVHATLKSEPFRRAYVAEYARLFSLTPDQRDALAEAERDEMATTIVVIAALYTANPMWNDLDPTRGFWEVRLQNPVGTSAPPRRVTRLRRNDPTWRSLYPYVDPHYVTYELRFDTRGLDGAPLALPGQPLTLVVSGAPAQLELTWVMP